MGFDVYYVIDEIRSLEDDTLLKIALDETRILITRDKDLGGLVFRLHKTHAGVILLRLEGYTTIERSDIVCSLIKQYQDRLANAFTVIQKGIIRIR